jgi:plasmid stabilization system protein ParE
MHRFVEYSTKAKWDLRRITASVQANVSSFAAERWLREMLVKIDDLENSPERFAEADEAKTLGRNLRARIVGNRSHVYRVIFEVLDDRVIVYRVRHASQDTLTDHDL